MDRPVEEEQASGSAIRDFVCVLDFGGVLCLAALYESWTIPLSVILVVPLGFARRGFGHRGEACRMTFISSRFGHRDRSVGEKCNFDRQVAKDLQAQGKNAFEAALAAAHLRFRPIIMTSLAFIMGVVPLYFSSGASSASQRAIGTSVFWGMLVGTCLAVFSYRCSARRCVRGSKTPNASKSVFTNTLWRQGMTPDLVEQYVHEAEEGLTEQEREALHHADEPKSDADKGKVRMKMMLNRLKPWSTGALLVVILSAAPWRRGISSQP